MAPEISITECQTIGLKHRCKLSVTPIRGVCKDITDRTGQEWRVQGGMSHFKPLTEGPCVQACRKITNHQSELIK